MRFLFYYFVMDLQTISRTLSRDVGPLAFVLPVTHVYNPLEYAQASHEEYLKRYGAGRKTVLLLGMNPGPFGMAQTGIPFGEVSSVRDWLMIAAQVGRPEREHPRRPVLGFRCPRSEVSGKRLWGWARERFGGPENFFKEFFVANYCPLLFLEESGRNRTPDQLPAAEQESLFAVCDEALRRMVNLLRPGFVLGVGKFAEGRARKALGDFQGTIGSVPHPSPANPQANRGWARLMDKELARLGITRGSSSKSCSG